MSRSRWEDVSRPGDGAGSGVFHDAERSRRRRTPPPSSSRRRRARREVSDDDDDDCPAVAYRPSRRRRQPLASSVGGGESRSDTYSPRDARWSPPASFLGAPSRAKSSGPSERARERGFPPATLRRLASVSPRTSSRRPASRPGPRGGETTAPTRASGKRDGGGSRARGNVGTGPRRREF